MAIRHHILASAYHPLKIKNIILRKFNKPPYGRLRVLTYHGIEPEKETHFATQLKWLQKSWKFIDLQKFEAIINGEIDINEDSLLLTFDDGYSSNRRIAETILKPLKIKALFFIISDFAALSVNDDWREFIIQGIYPSLEILNRTNKLKFKTLDSIPNHWRNMDWNDLSYLLENGHSIGAHTATHARLSDITKKDLQKEIIDSANKIEKRMGIDIEHFAYTFGNLSSFSSDALTASRQRFKYIYTGLRGDNVRAFSPWAIRRDSMSTNDSLAWLGFLLEGGVDWYYKKDLLEYKSWESG